MRHKCFFDKGFFSQCVFKKMAVTRKQAEGYWEKYNKDKNDVLTAEEVKECLQEVYETVDDQDVAVSTTEIVRLLTSMSWT